jgi:CubicO group peptidase (beta-lactamase class C family)
MGFMLVGRALVERSGLELDELVRREVTEPLGVADRVGSARQLRRSLPGFDARVAPTEVVTWRGGVVRGEVHDENAMMLSGEGLSGHAGLFGDAPSVLAVGVALLEATRRDLGWLGPAELAVLTQPRPGGTLLAGFDGRSPDKPSSGSRVSDATFGHLGFTGTSLWIDPIHEFVGVLLTNRVHPTREHLAIREARPAAYDAMFDALSSSE